MPATIRRSLDFGASGFVPKRFGVETLREAITKVLGGRRLGAGGRRSRLGSADPDTAALARPAGDADAAAGAGADDAVGGPAQQADRLRARSVSEATIKAHVSAILQKLGVESRTQAVIAAAKIAGGQWRQGTPTG